MRPPTARLLAAGAMVALGCLAVGAGATVVTTCRAAADSDARVDYRFCLAQLGRHRERPDADKKMLVKPGTAGPKRAALEQCSKLYDSMGYAFAKAVGELNYRRYGSAKEKAASFAHQCDDALAKAGAVPSPMAKRSSYSVKIAIICTAITNLIK